MNIIPMPKKIETYNTLNLIQIFSPEMILLSGVISNEGDRLLSPLKEKLSKNVELRIATLKNDAGIIGAAELAQK